MHLLPEIIQAQLEATKVGPDKSKNGLTSPPGPPQPLNYNFWVLFLPAPNRARAMDGTAAILNTSRTSWSSTCCPTAREGKQYGGEKATVNEAGNLTWKGGDRLSSRKIEKEMCEATVTDAVLPCRLN
eukprot:11131674-Heterocapsa_arctica.AAC.1